MAYRKETTALAVDNKARRAIARAWNASRAIEGWPRQELIEPPLKPKEGAELGGFSAAIASRSRFSSEIFNDTPAGPKWKTPTLL
jgi:hypothetical protein